MCCLETDNLKTAAAAGCLKGPFKLGEKILKFLLLRTKEYLIRLSMNIPICINKYILFLFCVTALLLWNAAEYINTEQVKNVKYLCYFDPFYRNNHYNNISI